MCPSSQTPSVIAAFYTRTRYSCFRHRLSSQYQMTCGVTGTLLSCCATDCSPSRRLRATTSVRGAQHEQARPAGDGEQHRRGVHGVNTRGDRGGERRVAGKSDSHTGTRTRVAWVKATYPNHLDYMGEQTSLIRSRQHPLTPPLHRL